MRFHHLRRPADVGQAEVEAFLSHLATELPVSASTQNQALAALLFLYAEVLKQPLGNVNALRAKKSHYVQPNLSAHVARRILANLSGVPYLAACLMYGVGLRLMECLRLRVKDIDLEINTITAHDTKSNRDRVTFLPGDGTFLSHLRAHLDALKRRYDAHPGLPGLRNCRDDPSTRRPPLPCCIIFRAAGAGHDCCTMSLHCFARAGGL